MPNGNSDPTLGVDPQVVWEKVVTGAFPTVDSVHPHLILIPPAPGGLRQGVISVISISNGLRLPTVGLRNLTTFAQQPLPPSTSIGTSRTAISCMKTNPFVEALAPTKRSTEGILSNDTSNASSPASPFPETSFELEKTCGPQHD
jgi:hypothetical protein